MPVVRPDAAFLTALAAGRSCGAPVQDSNRLGCAEPAVDTSRRVSRAPGPLGGLNCNFILNEERDLQFSTQQNMRAKKEPGPKTWARWFSMPLWGTA